MELGLAGTGGGSSMLNKLFDASLDLSSKYATQQLGLSSSGSTALTVSNPTPAAQAPGGMDTNTMLLLAAAAVAVFLFMK